MVEWCWINFQSWGVLLIWIIVGQGPAALAVGAGVDSLDIFSLDTVILSQRAVKPKITDQLKASLALIWLVGCFGFNGPLRQYFSLYRAVSQREGERGKKG